MYTDKILECKDCGESFVFTAGEQEFYAQKGFDSMPSRCKKCREQRRAESRGRSKRVMYEIVCARCGKVESIPFEPSHDKAVYCNECYKAVTARQRS